MEAARTDTPAGTDEDPRGIALAHAALDGLGVPRSDDRGHRLTLFGRIEQLRAGKCDLSRITRPAAARELRSCAYCGLHVLPQLGGRCPSCGQDLDA